MLIDDSAEVDEEDNEGGKLSDDEDDRDSSVERDQDTQEDKRIIVEPRQLFGEEYLRPIQRTGGEKFRAVLDRHEIHLQEWSGKCDRAGIDGPVHSRQRMCKTHPLSVLERSSWLRLHGNTKFLTSTQRDSEKHQWLESVRW
ncbi:hypothetical protein PM082_002335 [Marasmius tenuissimus]|nr:hypothetical protein PM082_002335 [Marasmius tenuissimus]